MAKKKKNLNTRKEIMIIGTAMFYLTIFLEKAGVIIDNKFVDNVSEYKDADITGAISLGRQMMFILKKIKLSTQQEALTEAQKIFDSMENKIDFNYLVFVLILLMSYKEQMKNKVFHIPTSYDELNDIFDEYFALGLKDKEQMEIIKDSSDIADEFFEKVMQYGNKDNSKRNRQVC